MKRCVVEQAMSQGDEMLIAEESSQLAVLKGGVSGLEQTTEPLSLSAVISALLFVSVKPLSLASLAEAAKTSTADVEEALDELKLAFSEHIQGIRLIETAGGYQLRTTPQASRFVHRLIPPKAKKLSRAAAETLAVIAYKQPVQRAEIEAIRGVDALPTLKTLIEARLIRVVGRAESPGHPALYGTTQTFLEKFGLRDLSELPTVRELEQLASEPGEPESENSAAEAVAVDDDLSGEFEETF